LVSVPPLHGRALKERGCTVLSPYRYKKASTRNTQDQRLGCAFHDSTTVCINFQQRVQKVVFEKDLRAMRADASLYKRADVRLNMRAGVHLKMRGLRSRL
jgi:hypothetical protein